MMPRVRRRLGNPEKRPKSKGIVSLREKAARYEQIEELLLQGNTYTEIHRRLAPVLHCSYQVVVTIAQRIEADWQSQRGATVSELRARQQRRIEHWMTMLVRAHMTDLRDEYGEVVLDSRGNPIKIPDAKKIPWNQLARFEQIFGAISGTNRPIEVHHSGAVGVAVAGIIASMTDEEAMRMAATQLEIERKAALAEKFGIEDLTAPMALTRAK
jgi:hypothetical protein